ncbi:MAG: Mov34/MPN/PAD-1 family protein [Candidatus Thermoplasmatota archaeon]|nr:Mov34/MPN/PAD-1 family protein [Candidatus Thermoplasmatota archaeon]
MPFFKKNKEENGSISKRKWQITKRCLRLILESAKSTHPKEFGGLLRVDETTKKTIIEVVLLPGTISGNSHAIFQLHMMPIDFSVVGTVHSHPSGMPLPSEADLELFRKHGRVHIIVATPYTKTSWRAYDYNGSAIEMSVI